MSIRSISMVLFGIICYAMPVYADINNADALTQQATQLLQQGQMREAAHILSPLMLTPNPPLQALFLSGQIAGNQGQWSMAIRYYRILLERAPAMLRVRLELARALYMNRELDAATHHFNLVLGEPTLPKEVRVNVMTYINQIDKQTFSQSLAIELLNDSNINQATANPIIMIGNQPFVLSQGTTQQAGLGIGFVWQGKYRFGDTHQYHARSVLQHKDHPNVPFDFTYLQSYLGVTQQWHAAHSLNLEGGAHIAWYAGKKLYDGFAVRAVDTWRTETGFTLNTSLDSKQLTYPDFGYRNSWQHGLSLDAAQALAAGVLLTGGVNYGRNLAQETTYSFVSNGAKLGGMMELPWRTVGSLSLDYQRNRYDGHDPFFGLIRQEHKVGVEVGILPAAWAWQGFAPRLVLGYANNRANIPLYSYRKNYAKIVFTRDF